MNHEPTVVKIWYDIHLDFIFSDVYQLLHFYVIDQVISGEVFKLIHNIVAPTTLFHQGKSRPLRVRALGGPPRSGRRSGLLGAGKEGGGGTAKGKEGTAICGIKLWARSRPPPAPAWTGTGGSGPFFSARGITTLLGLGKVCGGPVGGLGWVGSCLAEGSGDGLDWVGSGLSDDCPAE